MMRILLLLLVPSIAAAAPATKLSMKRTDGTNLHIAKERGAIHWDEDTTVVVELRANGIVAASVVGTRKEHNLYADPCSSYETDDVTTWETTWTGTFKGTADTLVLELAVDADTCSRTKTTCRAAAKRTKVSCSTTKIEISGPAVSKPIPVDAWTCSPKGDADLGESPAWLLGKNRCIRVHTSFAR